jgi:cystathionine gamma-synthase/methionine-gamma-lyase
LRRRNVAVDVPEASGDLGAIESADRCAQRIPNGHPEKCPEKLILCCLRHPTTQLTQLGFEPSIDDLMELTIDCLTVRSVFIERQEQHSLVPPDAADREPEDQTLGFASRAVHSGERGPRPDFTPTVTPIYPATAFVYDDTDTLDAVFGNERPGYVYTRYANPTTNALEAAIASLEGTEDTVAFASGMGAVYAAILLDARTGDRIVAAPDVYGASYSILAKLMPTLGVETVFVDLLDLESATETIAKTKPTLVYAETISNPLMRIANLPALAAVAHQHGARIAVDNTFASPWLVNPASFGADSVIHSTTKYLGGHGDVTGGVIATSAERAAELREINKLIGSVSSPFDSWLTLRGLKTLPLRMKQQSDNAAAIARWLAADSRVSRVNYPGLTNLGDAEAIFNRPERGGMISFEIASAGREEVFRFLEALRLVVPATTLGDVYSLVLYPAISSHRAVPVEEREKMGISDGLVRLSVGIEDVDDILADVDRALSAAKAA